MPQVRRRPVYKGESHEYEYNPFEFCQGLMLWTHNAGKGLLNSTSWHTRANPRSAKDSYARRAQAITVSLGKSKNSCNKTSREEAFWKRSRRCWSGNRGSGAIISISFAQSHGYGMRWSP